MRDELVDLEVGIGDYVLTNGTCWGGDDRLRESIYTGFLGDENP